MARRASRDGAKNRADLANPSQANFKRDMPQGSNPAECNSTVEVFAALP
jgi:hypothetical protein